MGWQKRIYDESLTLAERGDVYEAFADEMVTKAREALKESELDLERYEVVATDHWACVHADGWEMTEKEDANELRDALLGAGFVDVEDVGVFVYPRTLKGEIGPLPPVMDGYSVEVKLHKDVAVAEEELSEAMGRVDDGSTDRVRWAEEY